MGGVSLLLSLPLFPFPSKVLALIFLRCAIPGVLTTRHTIQRSRHGWHSISMPLIVDWLPTHTRIHIYTHSFVSFLKSFLWRKNERKMAELNNRGVKMIAIITVLISLALFSVILRVFARIKRRVGFGVDDYLCLFSAVVLLSMLIELILCKLVLILPVQHVLIVACRVHHRWRWPTSSRSRCTNPNEFRKGEKTQPQWPRRTGTY